MYEQAGDIFSALHEENADTEKIARGVVQNKDTLDPIVAGITSTSENYRYNCYQVLLKAAQLSPEQVYPYWDGIAGLLDSENTYHRCAAVYLLPNLIPADNGKRFAEIFDKYFGLLDDKSVIPPCYIARNVETIVSFKPEYLKEIVARLLAIESTGHKEGRKDLIKADIIQAFSAIYEKVDDKQRILKFVEDQLNCSSPKTRKLAKEFLEKQKR